MTLTTKISDYLVQMIELFREDPELELEASLGTIFPDTNENREEDSIKGNVVAQDVFHLLKNRFFHSAKEGLFDCTQNDMRCIDCFYDGNVRMRCQKVGEAELVIKHSLAKLVSSCPQRPHHKFAFHLRKEQKIDLRQFDLTRVPVYVRIQQVWAFTYKNAVLYTFKQVQSGHTREDACKQQRVQYEIEVELLHNKPYLDSKTNLQMASTMVEKVLDLCPKYNEHNIRQKLTMVFADLPLLSSSEASRTTTKQQKEEEGNPTTNATSPTAISSNKRQQEEEQNLRALPSQIYKKQKS